MGIYQELEVWQKSLSLSIAIYKLTEKFPDSEKFGLTNQMRRCSVSIASNIAEGHDRRSDPDFVRFLRISNGSSAELDTQLSIAKELGFISNADFDKINTDLVIVRKMLNNLIKVLKKTTDHRPETKN